MSAIRLPWLSCREQRVFCKLHTDGLLRTLVVLALDRPLERSLQRLAVEAVGEEELGAVEEARDGGDRERAELDECLSPPPPTT